jgi:undecaprenyl-diphosphatase
MNILDATLLGALEGVTEFLPISSTGHLILASALLNLTQTDFLKSFEIAVQLGAIASVVVLYYKLFLNIEILKKLFIAFLPTGVIGLLLYKVLKTYLLGNEYIVLATLFVGGIVLIAFELWYKEPADPAGQPQSLTYQHAFALGLFQSIAVIPGVSRSAAVIVGGLWLGFPRRMIVEFSFLLAVPTMLAATGLDLVKSASGFSAGDFWLLAVGFIVAFLVAIVSIKFLLRFIKTHTFVPFGVYRIVAAILFFVFVVWR